MQLGLCRRLGLAAFRLDLLDLFQNNLGFLRIDPFLIPVQLLAVLTLATLCGGFQNEFCHVLVWWAVDAAIGEIFDDILSFFTNGPEVEGIAPGVKSQDHVKLLEKDR